MPHRQNKRGAKKELSQIGGTGNYRHVSNDVSVTDSIEEEKRTRTQAGADLDRDT